MRSALDSSFQPLCGGKGGAGAFACQREAARYLTDRRKRLPHQSSLHLLDFVGLLLLSTAPLFAQLSPPVRAASTAAVNPTIPNPVHGMKIAPQTFRELEKRFDTQLASVGAPNSPIDVLGTTRGLYLDGYGAVFTTEVSLIVTPQVNPFRQQITKEEAASVHQRKLNRLPLLRQAMGDMMKTSALTLIQIPESQQIVLSVRLLYLPWEDTTGLPAQITLSATRGEALRGQFKTEEQ